MSDFDAYYKWLGIPPEEQPPTHYRLLGIQTLEKNTEVIEAAANRQMSYLQELSGGDEHVDEAQRLLGEVAKARVCLLNTESKARYDAELTSSLDALPEAPEGSSTETSATSKSPATRPAAEPIEVKPSGRSRQSTSGGTARKTPTGRSRTGRTPKAAGGSSKGSKTKSSNDLALKIGALAGTAIVVLIVGILLLGGGGSDSSKKPKPKTTSKTNTPSGSVASKTGAPAPVSSAAEKRKTDNDLDRRLARIENENPNPPKPKPPKTETPKAPETNAKPSGAASSNIVADTDANTGSDTSDKTETDASELSEAEQAEALLESRGLEEKFNSVWELVDLTAAFEEVSNASPNSSSAEIEQKVRTLIKKEKEIIVLEAFDAALSFQADPANPEKFGILKSKISRLVGIANWDGKYTIRWDFDVIRNNTIYPKELAGPWHEAGIVAVPFDADEARIRQEVIAKMGPPSTSATSEATSEIARQLRAQYAALQANAEIQAALKTVGGTLADPPELLDDPSITPPPPSSNPSTKKDTPPEPSADFDELKEQLTAVEKETRLALGTFNKGAKEFLKKKKELVKRIKKGESMIAQRSKFQDSLPDGEQKTKFGQETETKYVKPLNDLKMQLQSLAKPDAAPLEEKLKESEKLIEQLKKTSGYAESPKSVDSLAEKVAKYRRGFEVQQTKMAK